MTIAAIRPVEDAAGVHHAGLIRRPQLEALLDEGRRHQVTLVSAPPGAGKTSLARSWMEQQPDGAVAWITLEPRHNDGSRLTSALRAALRGAPRRELGALLVDAAAAGVRVLVLDDVHELTTPAALSVLERLVAGLPPGLDLILATRADPPLHTGPLRLDGRLGEIRNAALAFSLDEAEEMLARHGLTLRTADVRALWHSTEGWAAGLGLVAMALEAGADPHQLAMDNAATGAVVADYLLTEVLARLDEDDQEFLLRVSGVDRVSADLATVLTDEPGAGKRLLEFEHQGILSICVDDGTWYRTHALMRALLRGRLKRRDPALARDVHRTAAGWYAEHAMFDDAEDQARLAEDWTLLGQVVLPRWLAAVRAGKEPRPLVAGVPTSAVVRSPALVTVALGNASRAGDTDEASILRPAFDEIVPDDDDRQLEEARGVVALLYQAAFGADERLTALTGGHERDDAFARLRLAELALDSGDLVVASRALEALITAPVHGSVAQEASALLALVLVLQGRADDALRTLSSLAEAPAGAAAVAAAAMTETLAAALSGRPPSPDASPRAPGSRALSVCARVIDATALSARFGPVRLDAGSARHPLATHVLVTLGVVDVVDVSGVRVSVGGPAESIVRRAREAVGTRGFRPALALVQPWTGDTGDRDVHPRTRVELRTLAAVASSALDDRDAALEYVGNALELVIAGAARAPLVDHGPELTSLLEWHAFQPGSTQGLAVELLDTLTRIQAPAVVEALTDRESVVLHFLPTLMSNAEIAGAMHVSVNTVKTHLKALYRKLGVDRRRDAVVRGRQLEML